MPAHVATESPADRLNAELRRALFNARESSQVGFLYHLTETMNPAIRPIFGSDADVGASESWRVLRLGRKDAARLARSIDACLKNFEPQNAQRGKVCLVHYAIAPRE